MRKSILAVSVAGALVLGMSLAVNGVLIRRNRELAVNLQMQRQREMADVADAMSDIEINLQKLIVAAGAAQSVGLLSDTAVLAQMVESGLSRLPLHADTAADTIRFAGQMGQYAMTLATQVSAGGMLSGEDERQLAALLAACRALNSYLSENQASIYAMPAGSAAAFLPEGGTDQPAIDYPSLIYDGPFSDGRTSGAPKGLTGERIAREQAREIAARAAGTTADQVKDEADSGGAYEAFGFSAKTAQGNVNVQITGIGGHVLWMMPEQAEFAAKKDRETCLRAAKVWLADLGFGEMEACFVQEYDGMIVANFAAVQDGVLLYPDQVKVQVSMESGTVVGAECTQYLSNHHRREALEPGITIEQAKDMVSSKLEIRDVRLCVIPKGDSELLCWGFEGGHQGNTYWVFIDAASGEAADILRVIDTSQGEMAL